MSSSSTDITIAYAVDDNYWMQLFVSMFSLLRADKSKKYYFYIVCESIDDTFEKNTRHLHQDFDFEISYIHIEGTSVADYPLLGTLTRAVYYRLFVGSLLPDDLHRVLYFDCDTVVCRPIAELFDYDIEDMIVGAIVEAEPSIGERLGVDPYFNSGVMLIDLDRWRTEQIESKALKFLEHEWQRIFCPDQDVLNSVLIGRWKQLPPIFNLHSSYCEKSLVETLPAEPVIIHYCGGK
ncbi:MAG: glycosyltransferase family 8 protein [Hyphomicrobiales bacterium]|nr:glycosyltransferase family 8 protein [Hyphomicrobiales bacterium]MCP5000867.1 glycosyltransferase family 8 protein [Hyphomicrobiales bacterium]